ncbi:MAG: serine hydrolase [Pseudomonadales bacterium]|nr:serine hydrolase [Pseudomonadales bacterium]
MFRRHPFAWIVVPALLLAPAFWFFTDTRLSGVAAGLDRDGSGLLERDEVGPVVRRAFGEVDRDGSGAVDAVEFRRWVLARWLSGATRPLAVPSLPERPDAEALRAWLRAPVANGELDGVGLLLLVEGEVVFRHVEGSLAADAAVPLASASTWPAALVFACLQERGELDLERPVGRFAPELPAAWAELPATRLLSHSSGAPGGDLLAFDAETSLATAGRNLVLTRQPTEPGRVFRYGGVSLQVAAWWAETVTERSWRRLSVECLAWPLSLESAAWGHALAGPAAEGFVDVGAGLSMSLDDYGAFLSMLQQEGRYGGVRNLSPATLRLFERDRIGDMPREALPPTADPDWGYALGAWCERRREDGRCTSLSSPGALGAYPWLDRERGIAGMILTVDALPRTLAWSRATRQLAERVYGRNVLTSDARGRSPGG